MNVNDIFFYLIASKCFQCNGMTKNEECNQQGIASCEPGQGCTTTIIQGKIYKGCSYPADDYKDDTMNFMTCYGSWCNQPLMTTHKGKDGYWWKFLYTLFTRYSMAFIKHWLLNMGIFFYSEKDPKCQPYTAIQCGMDLVPSLVLNRMPNLR